MTRTAKPRTGERVAAADLPVARVCVDVPLAHLDRPFDYQVPADLAVDAVPGCRVRVRFAGRLVDGFLLDRVAVSDHPGRLGWLEKVVSAEPVLSADTAALVRTIADRYAGTMIDVLRLAVPPRHARVEKSMARKDNSGSTAVEDERAAAAPAGPDPIGDDAAAADPAAPEQTPARPDAVGWRRYPRGPAFLDAVHAGKPARAVWQALPGEDWPARLAEVAATAAAADRGAVLVVPDHRDLDRVHAACVALLGADGVVALSAGLGPAERYRRWLAVRHGRVRVAVGTRATAFAPVATPGALVIWDDGDDLHADQRAPYPHAREVLMQRAHASGCAFLAAGFARSAEAQVLVESGWAPEIVAARDSVRAAAPRVTAVGADTTQLTRDAAARTARLPSIAFEAAREALRADRPVLVQVPRRGYVPGLACGECRERARCRRCAGPLALPGGHDDGVARPPYCTWCGVSEAAYRCAACGSRRLRATAVGARRTAEELGRAFAGVPIRTSGGTEVLATVPVGAGLVVATPGAEPVADGGYGAALLLDGWALLSRPDLRVAEETVRRWLSAAALVRPATDGGRVVVMADSTLAPVQALVRWDPAWHAAAELAARAELGFPPAVRMAAVDGPARALADLLDGLDLPPSAEVLGPVPLGEITVDADGDPSGSGGDQQERALIRVPRRDGRELAARLAAAQATRTARKEPDLLRVRLDPLDLI